MSAPGQDPLAFLTRNPHQLMGGCLVAIVVLVLLAVVLGTIWPVTVAAVPTAILALSYIAETKGADDGADEDS